MILFVDSLELKASIWSGQRAVYEVLRAHALKLMLQVSGVGGMPQYFSWPPNIWKTGAP
jgi:hypothetical protein